MITITTTLVDRFHEDTKGLLSAELDPRPTGYNFGQTEFRGGSHPVILVYKSPDVSILSIRSSIDAITFQSLGTVDIVNTDEEVQFDDVAESSIRYPVHSGFTYQWVGNDLGLLVANVNKITAPRVGLGIAKVSYTARALAYRLNRVPITVNGEEDFNLLVHITGNGA